MIKYFIPKLSLKMFLFLYDSIYALRLSIIVPTLKKKRNNYTCGGFFIQPNFNGNFFIAMKVKILREQISKILLYL